MNKKKAYEEKLQAQLDEWNATIDTLKAKAEKEKAEAKISYLETIEELQHKRMTARKKLQELQLAGDDALEELKDGIQQAWSELGEAVKAAISKFK